MAGHVRLADVDFDPGYDPCVGDDLDQGNAVLLVLADRLVVEDHAADALTEAGCGHDQFPIGAPGFHGLRDPHPGKTFVAGRIAFIHR